MFTDKVTFRDEITTEVLNILETNEDNLKKQVITYDGRISLFNIRIIWSIFKSAILDSLKRIKVESTNIYVPDPRSFTCYDQGINMEFAEDETLGINGTINEKFESIIDNFRYTLSMLYSMVDDEEFNLNTVKISIEKNILKVLSLLSADITTEFSIVGKIKELISRVTDNLILITKIKAIFNPNG